MKISPKLLGIFLSMLAALGLLACSDGSAIAKTLSETKEELRAQYGENKKITDGNYDKSLAVKCINGTFVGKKNDGVI